MSGKKSHLRKTVKKFPPTAQTVTKIKESVVWQMENEFYQFAKRQFYYVKSKMFENYNAVDDASEMKENLPILRKKEFHYEKVKP